MHLCNIQIYYIILISYWIIVAKHLGEYCLNIHIFGKQKVKEFIKIQELVNERARKKAFWLVNYALFFLT